jgi:hypothetical protein
MVFQYLGVSSIWAPITAVYGRSNCQSLLIEVILHPGRIVTDCVQRRFISFTRSQGSNIHTSSKRLCFRRRN